MSGEILQPEANTAHSVVPTQVKEVADFAWQCVAGNWGFLIVIVPAICWASYNVGRFVREHEYQGEQMKKQEGQIQQQASEIAALKQGKVFPAVSGTGNEPLELTGATDDSGKQPLILPPSEKMTE